MNSFLKAFLTSLIFFGLFGFFCVYLLKQYISPMEVPRDSLPNDHSWTLSPKICSKDPHITFFMYHYIRDHDTKDNTFTKDLSVSPGLFSIHMKQVEQLAQSGNIVLMTGWAFLQAEKENCFPERPIWIFTADDGWIDMYDSLVPIASASRVPFFLGIITGDVWKKGFLTQDDVITISQNPLMTISSHSVTHSDNSLLNEVELKREMCDSKATLEKWIWKPVESYIYPSGRLNTEFGTKIEKECGYKVSWSTSFGKNFSSRISGFSQINRVRLHSDADPHFFDVFLKKEESLQEK